MIEAVLLLQPAAAASGGPDPLWLAGAKLRLLTRALPVNAFALSPAIATEAAYGLDGRLGGGRLGGGGDVAAARSFSALLGIAAYLDYPNRCVVAEGRTDEMMNE